jgi:hypothetical protein
LGITQPLLSERKYIHARGPFEAPYTVQITQRTRRAPRSRPEDI